MQYTHTTWTMDSHTNTLTTIAACISGVLLSSATLTQLTSAPCARASAMRGKCCIAADRYSKAPGWRPLRSSSSSLSVQRDRECVRRSLCGQVDMRTTYLCVCVCVTFIRAGIVLHYVTWAQACRGNSNSLLIRSVETGTDTYFHCFNLHVFMLVCVTTTAATVVHSFLFLILFT